MAGARPKRNAKARILQPVVDAPKATIQQADAALKGTLNVVLHGIMALWFKHPTPGDYLEVLVPNVQDIVPGATHRYCIGAWNDLLEVPYETGWPKYQLDGVTEGTDPDIQREFRRDENVCAGPWGPADYADAKFVRFSLKLPRPNHIYSTNIIQRDGDIWFNDKKYQALDKVAGLHVLVYDIDPNPQSELQVVSLDRRRAIWKAERGVKGENGECFVNLHLFAEPLSFAPPPAMGGVIPQPFDSLVAMSRDDLPRFAAPKPGTQFNRFRIDPGKPINGLPEYEKGQLALAWRLHPPRHLKDGAREAIVEDNPPNHCGKGGLLPITYPL